MARKSTQVAIGGVSAALCLILMFMTGLIPFATYALPALAGVVLIAVVAEMGWRTAMVVYVAVALLAIGVVPDREAALLFIFFFGYYPIIKGLIEKLRFKVVQLLVKYLLFNAAMVLTYLVVIYVLGIPDILESFGNFGRYSALVLLLMGNVVFAVYDFALTNIVIVYHQWFRPKILGKL